MATYTLDSTQSHITFSVRHMMFARVQGQFDRWTGKLVFDEADPTKSSVEATMDAASIDTHESLRDGFLRSADFLDAEKYPHLVFQSQRVERRGQGRYRVSGGLTIRGVTREVVLEVEERSRSKDAAGDTVVFRAKTAISRLDWGLKWSAALEAGGVLVADKVDIELHIHAAPAV